jgi:NAD(P)-dependent dehydrogenase (short-subunit alcohol dehydrogenase family)
VHGRVVLITGGSRGIGAQLAREVVARGGKVALVGLEPEELALVAAELGEARARAWVADVCDLGALSEAVDAAATHFGRLDVVVANAGIAPFGTVTSIDPDAFDKTLDVNVNGVFRTLRAAHPHLVQTGGHAVVVASVAALVATAGMQAYCASKSGVEALAVAYGAEAASDGITVTVVHPSWIDTDMVRDAEHDLPSFRAMRARLPWPVRSTTSVQACARMIADGIEARRGRVFVPRGAAILYWLRSLTGSTVGRRWGARQAAPLVEGLAADEARLGRSLSAREQALNIDHEGAPR